MNTTLSINNRTVVFTDPFAKEKPMKLEKNNIKIFDLKNNHFIAISNSVKSPTITPSVDYGNTASSGESLRRKSLFSAMAAKSSPRKTRRIYNEETKQLCINKVLVEHLPTRTVAKTYDVPYGRISHWLNKHPEWKGMHNNDDMLSAAFQQKVIEANPSLLPGHQEKNVRNDSVENTRRVTLARRHENSIAENIQPHSAQWNLQHRPVAEDLAAVQPFWRPW